MNPIFKRVFNLIPEQYRLSSAIAGGAVVDLYKATDIDVFVLALSTQAKIDAFCSALRICRISGITFRDEPKKQKLKPGHVIISDVSKTNDSNAIEPVKAAAMRRSAASSTRP